MWPKLLVFLLLVHCLAASPAPGGSTDAWSADNACVDEIPTVMIENQNDSTCVSSVLCYEDKVGRTRAVVKNCRNGQYFNAPLGYCSAYIENKDDPTCTTYISCLVSNKGAHSAKVSTCKANLYFDPKLKVCGSTKPVGCMEAETTTAITTTTTTAAPWNKEATCAGVTSGLALFTNEDDPTCTSYVHCYFTNGTFKAVIKNCKANQYFDSSSRMCVKTKPDYCT